MTYSVEHDTLSIYLSDSDRQQAQELAKQCLNPERGVQIYNNTLAVLATRRYLNLLDIPSDLAKSHSFNPVVRLFDDVADLYIPEVSGRLECRPIKAGESICYIPETVHTGRIGYMVVELNSDHAKATMKGFIQTVTVEQLPLNYLQPLDQLFDCLVDSLTDSLTPIPSVLTDWVKGVIGSEWLSWQALPQSPIYVFKAMPNRSETNDRLRQKISNLYRADDGTLSLPAEPSDFSPVDALAVLIEQAQSDKIRWDAAELLYEVEPDHPIVTTIKAKDLGLYLDGQKLALLVGIIMKSDGKALVGTRVYSIGESGVLPPGVTLSGRDEDDNAFFDVQARENDAYIQFLFTADVGDRFMLTVETESASITEHFEV